MRSIIAQSSPLALIALLSASTSLAVPVQYELSYEITSFAENPGSISRLPPTFGDLSLGTLLSMDLCWNSEAPPDEPGGNRFASAVCGYSLQLGDFTVTTNIGLGASSQVHSSGTGWSISFVDEVPRLIGPDASFWFLDIMQLGFGCSSFGGVTLPNDLSKCGDGQPLGRLAIGPLSTPNGVPCAPFCGAGGTIFTELRNVARVPEPGTFGLLLLGLMGIGARRFFAHRTRTA